MQQAGQVPGQFFFEADLEITRLFPFLFLYTRDCSLWNDSGPAGRLEHDETFCFCIAILFKFLFWLAAVGQAGSAHKSFK